MDIKVEQVELMDETGAFYATAVEANVEVDVDDESSWHITSIDVLGFDGKRQRVTRIYSPYNNHVEFEYIRDELMRSRKVQLQGSISEQLARDSAARDGARRRRAGQYVSGVV